MRPADRRTALHHSHPTASHNTRRHERHLNMTRQCSRGRNQTEMLDGDGSGTRQRDQGQPAIGRRTRGAAGEIGGAAPAEPANQWRYWREVRAVPRNSRRLYRKFVPQRSEKSSGRFLVPGYS